MRICLFIVIFTILAGTAVADTVVLKDGTRHTFSRSNFVKGKMEFQTAKGPVSFGFDEIEEIIAEPRPVPKPEPARPSVKPAAAVSKPAANRPTIYELKDLAAEYDRNVLAADDRYKGRGMMVRGQFEGVQEIFGRLQMRLSNPSGYFYFDKGARHTLTSLQRGQKVVIQGTCDGLTLGFLSFDNCRLVNVE